MTKTIMIVDDDSSVLVLIEIILSRKGFSVISADNAKKALSLLEKKVPDLFVLDIMMPGMNGIDLCQALRQRPDTAATPILILSAWSDGDLVQRALTIGANDYMQKTAMSAQMVQRVTALLEQAGMH